MWSQQREGDITWGQREWSYKAVEALHTVFYCELGSQRNACSCTDRVLLTAVLQTVGAKVEAGRQ